MALEMLGTAVQTGLNQRDLEKGENVVNQKKSNTEIIDEKKVISEDRQQQEHDELQPAAKKARTDAYEKERTNI